MKNLQNLINKFTERYEDLVIDKSASFLRATLKNIIIKLEDNDIIGAYNAALLGLEEANGRDTVKIKMLIDFIDLELNS